MHRIIFPLPTVVSIMLAATAFTAEPARADPPKSPAVTCTTGGLSSHPKFTQVSPGRAEYNFSGVCITRDGRSFGYRVDGTWTPSEANLEAANASEIYRIDSLSGPPQLFDVVLGARCARDPWLNSVTCTRVGDNVPDELRELWPDLAASPFPYSRHGIPYDQRAALIAEYDLVNGKIDRSSSLADRVRADTNSKLSSTAMPHAGMGRSPVEAVALNPQPLPPGPESPLAQSQLAQSQRAQQANSRADAVALNPQPLPPGPPDKQLVRPASSRADQAGIIIVSGKNRYPKIKAVSPVTAAPLPDAADPPKQP